MFYFQQPTKPVNPNRLIYFLQAGRYGLELQLEQHKVEILAKQLRHYNGHQMWCVMIREDGGPKQVVFFRMRYDLTETNERCLERLTLGVFMDDIFWFLHLF